jgi:RecA-family ATPase
MQAEATAGAAGLAYFTEPCEPYRSLLWNCEDDHDDIWRRQERICEHLGVPVSTGGGVMGSLHLESRVGCDNALMERSQGLLATTSAFEHLRQCVNDLSIDVVWLDNAAHVFHGDHDDRSEFTKFVNALNGIVRGRPFAS